MPNEISIYIYGIFWIIILYHSILYRILLSVVLEILNTMIENLNGALQFALQVVHS